MPCARPSQQLWARRTANPAADTDAVEQLVLHYRPLVNSEVHRARAKFPRHVDADELDAAGLESCCSWPSTATTRRLGTTVRSATRATAASGARFSTASARWTARPAPSAAPAKCSTARPTVSSSAPGRQPGMEELAAEEADVTPDELRHLERYSRMSAKLSLDAVSSNGHSDHDDSYSTAAGLANEKVKDPLQQLYRSRNEGGAGQRPGSAPRSRTCHPRAALSRRHHVQRNRCRDEQSIASRASTQIHGRALERLCCFLTCRE